MLCARLIKAGYAVLEAENGYKGLEVYRKEPVGVVVTDIIMPEKEGMETILELKRLNPRVRIVAISGGGRSTPEDYLNIAEYFGAVKSFMKPFDMNEFIDTLDNLV